MSRPLTMEMRVGSQIDSAPMDRDGGTVALDVKEVRTVNHTLYCDLSGGVRLTMSNHDARRLWYALGVALDNAEKLAQLMNAVRAEQMERAARSA